MREIKFQFLYRGRPYGNGNTDRPWFKKWYTLDQLIERPLHELSDVHSFSELVAKRQFTNILDMDGKELYERDIVNICYVKDGHIFDGKYRVSINTTGVTFQFIGMAWWYRGYNQFPAKTRLSVSDYGMLRSDYRNGHPEGKLCISEASADGTEYSNYIRLIGNELQNPELLEGGNND